MLMRSILRSNVTHYIIVLEQIDFVKCNLRPMNCAVRKNCAFAIAQDCVSIEKPRACGPTVLAVVRQLSRFVTTVCSEHAVCVAYQVDNAGRGERVL